MHLAAAGLAWGKDDGVAEALEYAHDGFAGLGEQGVVITGDEEGDLQSASQDLWSVGLQERTTDGGASGDSEDETGQVLYWATRFRLHVSVRKERSASRFLERV